MGAGTGQILEGTNQTAACDDFEKLVALHTPRVRRAVRRVLHGSADEEDIAQEAFARLVVRLRQPGELCVGPWLTKVARNLAIDHLRRRYPVPAEAADLDTAVGEGLDHSILASELRGQVALCMAHLPARQRAALAAQAARSGRGGTAAVAAAMGLSESAAESLLARSRKRLRGELRRAGVVAGGGLAAFGGLLAAAGTTLAARHRHLVIGTLAGTLATALMVAGGVQPRSASHDPRRSAEVPWSIVPRNLAAPPVVAGAPGAGAGSPSASGGASATFVGFSGSGGSPSAPAALAPAGATGAVTSSYQPPGVGRGTSQPPVGPDRRGGSGSAPTNAGTGNGGSGNGGSGNGGNGNGPGGSPPGGQSPGSGGKDPQPGGQGGQSAGAGASVSAGGHSVGVSASGQVPSSGPGQPSSPPAQGGAHASGAGKAF